MKKSLFKLFLMGIFCAFIAALPVMFPQTLALSPVQHIVLVIFVFGILSYPIAEKVINAVISGGGASGGFTTDSLQLPGIGG